MEKYFEKYEDSKGIRHDQYNQLLDYLDDLSLKADTIRHSYFSPDYESPEKYAESLEKYRIDLKKTIGFPPPAEDIQTDVKEVFVGEDDLCYIYRLFIKIAKGIECYGIYMVPKASRAKMPLVLSFHGGANCPELICNFGGEENNHHDASRRFVAEGYIVFSPLFIYNCMAVENDTIIPVNVRDSMDQYTKWLGTSLPAVELFKVSKALDYLLTRPEVDENEIGVVGLSYGGFYALMISAIDARIKFCISSCYFNDRKLIREKYPAGFWDWYWYDSLAKFTDVELAGMICPRLLIIEVGTRDELFPVEGASSQAIPAAEYYKKLKIGDRFKYIEFDGVHEFNLIEAMSYIKEQTRHF